ncbi:MAG: pyridoxal-phosphate dependent enzyme, partial [Candidatus Cloacimonadaceae bacterium]|nr:pyridoxal-phosphate dependent enzyme [Candidatus Cloacimonadaceae bacterium]
MNYFKHFRCTSCDALYARDELRYLCPVCSQDYKPGMPLPGVLETVFDYAAIGARWKEIQASGSQHYAKARMDWLCDHFSAVERKHYPPLPVGETPLFEVFSLGVDLGMDRLFIKNDGVNPSGSYKDRASQLVVAEANRLGIEEIVCASTGNAASSLACLCASAGKKAVIFAPAKAPVAKLVQILVH